jgi:hypothetical protein
VHGSQVPQGLAMRAREGRGDHGDLHSGQHQAAGWLKQADDEDTGAAVGGAQWERSSKCGEEGMVMEMDCGGGGQGVGPFIGLGWWEMANQGGSSASGH